MLAPGYEGWVVDSPLGNCSKMVEMDETKYSQYVVDIENGTFIGKGYTWVVLIVNKSKAQSLKSCQTLGKLSE